jgi:hypothetical protein
MTKTLEDIFQRTEDTVVRIEKITRIQKAILKAHGALQGQLDEIGFTEDIIPLIIETEPVQKILAVLEKYDFHMVEKLPPPQDFDYSGITSLHEEGYYIAIPIYRETTISKDSKSITYKEESMIEFYIKRDQQIFGFCEPGISIKEPAITIGNLAAPKYISVSEKDGGYLLVSLPVSPYGSYCASKTTKGDLPQALEELDDFLEDYTSMFKRVFLGDKQEKWFYAGKDELNKAPIVKRGISTTTVNLLEEFIK